MKILVSEDNELIISILRFRLKKDGHEVIVTQDGREALKKIEELLPDLVITDIMMPYLSGLEIVSAVKEKYKGKMSVIVLSVLGQENKVLEAFQLGADDYITKPFSPDELSERVKRLQSLIQSNS